MRVLLVEDEIRLAENVAHALRDGPGFAVDHAEDGQTALDLGENPCSERASIIQLLNCDADDYLSKPFDLGEVIARAKALIRRGEGMASPALRLEAVINFYSC
jgi:two-component system response regulator PhoP